MKYRPKNTRTEIADAHSDWLTVSVKANRELWKSIGLKDQMEYRKSIDEFTSGLASSLQEKHDNLMEEYLEKAENLDLFEAVQPTPPSSDKPPRKTGKKQIAPSD